MTDGVKKHRHDLGQEDHGPVMAAGTTRAIQGLLGVWIVATLLALGWAAIDANSGRGAASTGSPSATSPSATSPSGGSTSAGPR